MLALRESRPGTETLPLISIVIPTYNRARDLERALNSVLAQTYRHWEALVVDNHSTDDTDGIVKHFDDARIRLHKVHNGGVIAVSRNVGITHARGEYVAFLDSDDWWSTDKLEESMKYLEQGADVVYHDLFRVTKPRQKIFLRRVRSRDLGHNAFENLILYGNGLPNSSVIARRSLLCAIEGLAEDPRLIAAEDYDAWLRIAKTPTTFKRIPRTLGHYWAGGGTVSNPDRTLKTLDAIEERYASELCDVSKASRIVWLNYARGRSYYQLRSYSDAKQNLELIKRRRPPLFVWLKVQWMLFVIRLTQGHCD